MVQCYHCTATALPSGQGLKCREGQTDKRMDGWMDGKCDGEHVKLQTFFSVRSSFGPHILDPLGFYTTATTFSPPPPSWLSSFKEDWSLFQTIHPSSGSGARGTQRNAGSWTDFRGENRITIALGLLSDLSEGVCGL